MKADRIKNRLTTSRDQELVLMRQNVQAMRDRTNQDFDAMLARIDSLLPPETETRYQRLKNADWPKEVKSW